MSPPRLLDALRAHASARPDAPVLTFRREGTEQTWTWRELALRVGGVAAALRERAAPGERVLLLYPQGLDVIAALLGCMEAGVLAVPLQPPQAHRPQLVVPKLEALTADGGVVLACAPAQALDATRALLSGSALADLPWLATDSVPMAELPVVPAPAEVAYLQYTSGSTQTPRGVVVTHACLAENLATFDAGYAHDADSVMVSWLPVFHDLGLVYGVLMPLWKGFRAVLLDPVDFLRRPACWLEAISAHRGTHAGAPCFAYELCAAKVRPEERAGLDLSSWRVALDGAEPIRFESEARFVEAFAACGVRWTTLSHAYGMSEATAVISKEPAGSEPVWVDLDAGALERHEIERVPAGAAGSRRLAACGTPTAPTSVVVVDPDTLVRCAADRVGELWIGGPAVAQGYWRAGEASEATFGARTSDGEGPWLRTGDLGFVDDGRVVVTGRLKDLLIVRGENHYPQDLEWAVQQAHPAVRPSCVVAFTRTESDDDVVVVAEVYPDRLGTPDAVVAAIRGALADQGLGARAVVLVPPRSVAKTSSGKVMRRHVRAALATGGLDVLYRWEAGATPRVAATPDLHDVRAVVGEILGVPAEAVDPDAPLRELGLDSAQAVELAERLSRAVGRRLPDTVAFDHPTVRALVRMLEPSRSAPVASSPGDHLDELGVDELLALLSDELEDL